MSSTSFYDALHDSVARDALERADITASMILKSPAQTLKRMLPMDVDVPSVVAAAASTTLCRNIDERLALHAPEFFVAMAKREVEITLDNIQQCSNDLKIDSSLVADALVETQPMIDAAFKLELAPYAAHLITSLNMRRGGFKMLAHLVGSNTAIEASPQWRCECALMQAYGDCDRLLAQFIVNICCRLDAERGLASSRAREWSFYRKVLFACPKMLSYVLENSIEEIVDTYNSLGLVGLIGVDVSRDDAALRAMSIVIALARTFEAVREGNLQKNSSFEKRVAAVLPLVSLSSTMAKLLEMFESQSIAEVASDCNSTPEDAWLMIGIASSQLAIDTDLESDELCAVVSLWDGLSCVLPSVVSLLHRFNNGGGGGCAAGIAANSHQFLQEFLKLHDDTAATIEFQRQVGYLGKRVVDLSAALSSASKGLVEETATAEREKSAQNGNPITADENGSSTALNKAPLELEGILPSTPKVVSPSIPVSPSREDPSPTSGGDDRKLRTSEKTTTMTMTNMPRGTRHNGQRSVPARAETPREELAAKTTDKVKCCCCSIM